METMFCYQCEQTSGGTGCQSAKGVCGKTAHTSFCQDELTQELIRLAQVTSAEQRTDEISRIIRENLFVTLTNVNFNDEDIRDRIDQTRDLLTSFAPSDASVFPEPPMSFLWEEEEDIRSLKSLILFGIRGIAAYAYHAYVLGYSDREVDDFLYEALEAIGNNKFGMEELLPLVMGVGRINLACMELLDKANTETYGTPEPTEVTLEVEPGPFIVISGHDLYDLALLLEQTKDSGVNVYTHSEMLPAHAYPEFKKYSHLKGNYGTAWQNQQLEFSEIPAPVLFTTNCLMPVKDSYADRVYTTAMVSFPEVKHIDDSKDFSALIEHAKALGGYGNKQEKRGINGGKTVTTGFAHGAVLSVAPAVIEAVKAGDISHFFLVGGCDGARVGRNYYTEFVKQTPQDSIILTLACGKYRFNDLDMGTIGGLPRIMDMGQCNDAYSAIRVAVALAEAFECEVNDLPLTLVLSWYEQKAVSILLTLLYLGIKDILIGPSLPAFISPNILAFLQEKFNLSAISTAKEDLKRIAQA